MSKQHTKIIERLLLLVLIIVALYFGREKLAIFYCNQGITYSNRGLYKEAVDFYKKSIKINPYAAIVHYNLAYAYEQIRMSDDAIAEHRKAIGINPGYLNAYLGLSRIYLRRRMYEEALGLLKQAQVKFPNSPEIEMELNNASFEYMTICLEKGTKAFLAGDKQNALSFLNKAREIKPDFAYTYYTLGYIYFSEHKYNEAEEILQRAIQEDPRYWPAHKLLGDISLDKGNYEEAINNYGLALSINNNDAQLYNDLGITLMNIERYKEAAEYLRTALKLDPENPVIRYNLANVYKDAQMFDEAASEYISIIERHPDYPNVHNELAVTYSKQNKDDDALQEYQKEIGYCLKRLSIEPDNAVVLNSLAFAYQGLGKLEEAQELIKKVISGNLNYREAYFTLSLIQDKIGDKTGAISSLSKARDLSKQTGFIDKDIARLKEEFQRLQKTKTAHTIYLKNGRRLVGNVKSETGGKIILEMNTGGSVVTMAIPHGDIERIAGDSERIK